MDRPPPAPGAVRFGVFHLDLKGGELRKNGVKIRLQEQPFQILKMLLEPPGDVVTHQEIIDKLWPNGTVVEYEHSIKTAVMKLRQALDDNADTPRYVENLPRRGYRFIYPVNGVEAGRGVAPQSAPAPPVDPANVPPPSPADFTHAENFPNTTSLEAIHQQRLGKKGEVRSSQNQKFLYLCTLPPRTWGPAFKEYRADSSGNEALPKGVADGFMLTSGFTSAALIFHPTYGSESTFRYLGRQKVNGQETYTVAFAQIPGKAHLVGSFQAGQTSLPTYSQGLAWIDTSTYRIIRLHTDLLRSLPELRLQKEAMNIDFNEVHFKQSTQALWLPGQVTVTIEWGGKVLRNTHAYSDFKVFNVGSSEKIGAPKAAAGSPRREQEPAVTH